MPTLIRESKPTARKVHRCEMCRGEIQPGETYSRQTLKYDDLYDFNTCGPCVTDKVTSVVWEWCGGPDEGVNFMDAHEWAHDDDSPAACAYLRRFACRCERCVRAEPEGGAR